MNQSGRPDSNRGPHRPERCALPGCATPRRARQYSTRSRPAIVARWPRRLLDVLQEIDRLLEPARFQDYCPNGLQVPGATDVTTVATGVSAHAELFELAAAERAELLIVHHGLFWGAGAGPIDAHAQAPPAAPVRRRHRASPPTTSRWTPTPRSATTRCSPARSARSELEPFALHHGEPIGVLASLPGEGLPAAELFARVARHHLARAARVRFGAGAGASRWRSSRAPAPTSSPTRPPRARTRCSRASRPSARWRRRASPACTHRRRALRDRDIRRSGAWASTSPSASSLRHVFLDVPNPV